MRKVPTKTHSIAAAETADKTMKARVQSVQSKGPSSPKNVVTFTVVVPLAFNVLIEQEATRLNVTVEYLRTYFINNARAIIQEQGIGDHFQNHMPAIEKFFKLRRSELVSWRRISLSISNTEQEQLHQLAGDPLIALSDMKCAQGLFTAVLKMVVVP